MIGASGRDFRALNICVVVVCSAPLSKNGVWIVCRSSTSGSLSTGDHHHTTFLQHQIDGDEYRKTQRTRDGRTRGRQSVDRARDDGGHVDPRARQGVPHERTDRLPRPLPHGAARHLPADPAHPHGHGPQLPLGARHARKQLRHQRPRQRARTVDDRERRRRVGAADRRRRRKRARDAPRLGPLQHLHARLRQLRGRRSRGAALRGRERRAGQPDGAAGQCAPQPAGQRQPALHPRRRARHHGAARVPALLLERALPRRPQRRGALRFPDLHAADVGAHILLPRRADQHVGRGDVLGIRPVRRAAGRRRARRGRLLREQRLPLVRRPGRGPRAPDRVAAAVAVRARHAAGRDERELRRVRAHRRLPRRHDQLPAQPACAPLHPAELRRRPRRTGAGG